MPGPARPSFPSAPSEPGIRRLGVGGGSGGGGDDRPIRAQVVVAIVILLVLLAIPLYLLRRPSSHAADADGEASAKAAFSASVPVPAPSAREASERFTLAPPVRVRCGSAPGRAERGAPCDQLPFFESALSAAIKKNPDCAPNEKKGGTLNYVLKVDFDKQTLHLFAGASGTLKGPRARRAAQCVKQALPPAAWKSIPHQYRYYEIAILATYAPERAAAAPPGVAPLFQ